MHFPAATVTLHCYVALGILCHWQPQLCKSAAKGATFVHLGHKFAPVWEILTECAGGQHGWEVGRACREIRPVCV